MSAWRKDGSGKSRAVLFPVPQAGNYIWYDMVLVDAAAAAKGPSALSHVMKGWLKLHVSEEAVCADGL